MYTAYTNGAFTRLAGIVLLVMFAVYMVLTVRQSFRDTVQAGGADEAIDGTPSMGKDIPVSYTHLLVCSLIIAAVTLCICLGGLVLGRKFGMRLAGRAQILGGAILIFIGLEIFISSML